MIMIHILFHVVNWKKLYYKVFQQVQQTDTKTQFPTPIHAAARMNEITVQRKMYKKAPRAG